MVVIVMNEPYPYTPEQLARFVVVTRTGRLGVSRVEVRGYSAHLHVDSIGHHPEVTLLDDLGHVVYNTYHWHGPGKFVVRLR